MAPSRARGLLRFCLSVVGVAGEELCGSLRAAAWEAPSLLQSTSTQGTVSDFRGEEEREAPSAGAVAPLPLIPADDIVVGMAVTGQEPYRSRAENSKSTWARYFAVVDGFTFDEVPHAPWVRHVDLAFPEEGGGHGLGLTLAMVSEMLSLYPQAKWYLFVDDDTFVVPHQLYQVAMSMNSAEPTLAGRCFVYAHPRHGNLSFVNGGSGILASQALVRRVAPHVLDCRKRYDWHAYGDTRVASCSKHAFGGSEEYLYCRQPEFFNGLLEEAEPEVPLYPEMKAVTMHLKDPGLARAIFDSFAGAVTAGHDIRWKDVASFLKTVGNHTE